MSTKCIEIALGMQRHRLFHEFSVYTELWSNSIFGNSNKLSQHSSLIFLWPSSSHGESALDRPNDNSYYRWKKSQSSNVSNFLPPLLQEIYHILFMVCFLAPQAFKAYYKGGCCFSFLKSQLLFMSKKSNQSSGFRISGGGSDSGFLRIRIESIGKEGCPMGNLSIYHNRKLSL